MFSLTSSKYKVPNIDGALFYAKNGSWTALTDIDVKGLMNEFESLTLPKRPVGKEKRKMSTSALTDYASSILYINEY